MGIHFEERSSSHKDEYSVVIALLFLDLSKQYLKLPNYKALAGIVKDID